MYSYLQPVHSYLAYVALAVLLATVVMAVVSLSTQGNNSPLLRKLALIAMILCHVQLLIGLIVYFISPMGFSNLSGAAMSDATQRLLALEHPITNILAILLVTLGYRKVKRADKGPVAKPIMTFYGIGLVLLLSRIPWNLWFD